MCGHTRIPVYRSSRIEQTGRQFFDNQNAQLKEDEDALMSQKLSAAFRETAPSPRIAIVVRTLMASLPKPRPPGSDSNDLSARVRN